MPAELPARLASRPAAGPERNAVVYGLTKRGFFSEINVLVINLAYALAAQEDLYLDDSGFLSSWRQLLQPVLPMAAELREDLYRRVTVSNPKVDRAAWDERLWFVKRACDQGLVVAIPDIGFEGSWFELLSVLSRKVFAPLPELEAEAARLRLELGLDQPFCAVHIRRGDKTEGYPRRDGSRRIEGRAAPFGEYVGRLEILAPGVRRVFVLSDDHREVADARSLHPELELVTLCEPQEAGYRQPEFLQLSAEQRLRALKRLIVEVLIAVHCRAFVGLYRSNVSLMIAALHPHPEGCASVDQARTWTPMT